MVYHVYTALFLLGVPGTTFSNATHQVKAIVIGIPEDNPMAKINQLL